MSKVQRFAASVTIVSGSGATKVIVEFIGAPAVGKTTVAPIVAALLNLPAYRGQAFHGFDGAPLTERQKQLDRVLSVVRYPRLAYCAFGLDNRCVRRRIDFALNMCRRNRFAARAAQTGGVIESGPMHGLCQISANVGFDAVSLWPLVVHADVYVWLRANPDLVADRLRERQPDTARSATHPARVVRYEEHIARIVADIDRPVIAVTCNDLPDRAAVQAAGQISQLAVWQPYQSD